MTFFYHFIIRLNTHQEAFKYIIMDDNTNRYHLSFLILRYNHIQTQFHDRYCVSRYPDSMYEWIHLSCVVYTFSEWIISDLRVRTRYTFGLEESMVCLWDSSKYFHFEESSICHLMSAISTALCRRISSLNLLLIIFCNVTQSIVAHVKIL